MEAVKNGQFRKYQKAAQVYIVSFTQKASSRFLRTKAYYNRSYSPMSEPFLHSEVIHVLLSK